MADSEIVPKFQVGDRVRLLGHWEFPDGTIGTVIDPPRWAIEISEPGAWRGHFKLVRFRKGFVPSYVIKFDEPTHDDSSDGPYSQATIDEDSMVLIRESPGFD